MRIKKVHWIGIIASLLLLIANIVFFREDRIFFFLVGISAVVVGLPFLTTFLIERNVEKEKNERFLEFTRNLAESVKTGTPIGQSILNMKERNFGSLSPHVRKLANQISLGIPINDALNTFAADVGSDTVRRAIGLIREAENAGGEIDNILDSVSKSIYEIEKLQKERKAAIYNLVVQGYIIFIIFIGIMLIMQFKILPLTADVGSINSLSNFKPGEIDSVPGAEDAARQSEKLARPFLFLLITQGVFAGLTIGKLAEGSVKAGIKHSFILSATSFLVSTGANAFL